MSHDSERTLLFEIYRRLRQRFGHRRWWPASTPFEVIVGAILTQNTAWKNVSKALANLKAEGVLSVTGFIEIPEARLAALIRPSGYYNQKARKLKGFVAWLSERYGGDLEAMFKIPLPTLRQELLNLHGIGPETADSILLYAAGKKTFVVDAYTRRVFSRHGLLREDTTYEEIKEWFEQRLPRRLSLYNDFHAQIVQVAITHCRKTPQCNGCPMEFLFARPGLPPAPTVLGRRF